MKKKLAVVLIFATLLSGCFAYVDYSYSCSGWYTVERDIYGAWYHQHQGWYHY